MMDFCLEQNTGLVQDSSCSSVLEQTDFFFDVRYYRLKHVLSSIWTQFYQFDSKFVVSC